MSSGSDEAYILVGRGRGHWERKDDKQVGKQPSHKNISYLKICLDNYN